MRYYFIAIALLLSFIIFIGSTGYPVYATEPKPVGINVLDYGIFDANDDEDVITHELVVGQEYKIKTQFESELDIPVTFSYNIQIIDKNKHRTETVNEFKAESFLQPNDMHLSSFGFIPEYAGSFRTFAVFTNIMDGTTIGAVPQYDFEVISDTAREEKSNSQKLFAKTDVLSLMKDGRILPPLNQSNLGVKPDQIICNENLALIQKYDDSPACVKPETKEKLVERGWTKMPKIEEMFFVPAQHNQSIVIIPKGAVIAENEHLIPKEITVVLGVNNTVTWINQDDTGHGIASDKGGKEAWGSPGILKPGESFSVTFNSTGSYGYHGQPGPWRTGTVIVIDDDNAESLNKINCESQIHTNKPPEIYNITPTGDGAIVRWYQSPQTINGEHCGFPENYRIHVGLTSPVVPPFAFEDIIPAGFRGAYEITGLESNTTYYVGIGADWGAKVIMADENTTFSTLSPGSKGVAPNPIEAAKDEMSRNNPTTKENTD